MKFETSVTRAESVKDLSYSEQAPRRASVAEFVEHCLGDFESPRVVAISAEPDQATEKLLDAWRGKPWFVELRRGPLTDLPSAVSVDGWFTSAAELRALLTEHGPFVAIVDARRMSERSTVRFWSWAQRYLRKEGSHVIADGQERDTISTAETPDWASGSPSGLRIEDWQALAVAKATAGGYTPLQDGLAIAQGARYLHVISESEAAEGALSERLTQTDLSTLVTLPAVEW